LIQSGAEYPRFCAGRQCFTIGLEPLASLTKPDLEDARRPWLKIELGVPNTGACAQQ
jgi:hypothetical protein